MTNVEIGQKFKNYIILEEIGSGGMGKVYKAWDEKLKRHVAIKILNVDAIPRDNYQDWFKRFLSEARILAQLNHPSVMSIYDISDDENRPYLVMELIDGEAIHQSLKTKKRTVLEVLELFNQLAKALNYIHGKGILHRDIKPSNIIVTKDFEPKIIDFGISKWSDDPHCVSTKTQEFVGSIHYSAPELFDFAKVDTKVDIFAFGVTMANIFNEDKVFTGAELKDIIHSIRHEDPAFSLVLKNNLPAPLIGFLYRMVEKDPLDRYESMSEISKVLSSLKRNLHEDFCETSMDELRLNMLTFENDGVKKNTDKKELLFTMTLTKKGLELLKSKEKVKPLHKKNHQQPPILPKKKIPVKEPKSNFKTSIVAMLALVMVFSFYYSKATVLDAFDNVTSAPILKTKPNEIKEIRDFIKTLRDTNRNDLVLNLEQLEKNLIKIKDNDPTRYSNFLERVVSNHNAFKVDPERDYALEILRGNRVLEKQIYMNSRRKISSESSNE